MRTVPCQLAARLVCVFAPMDKSIIILGACSHVEPLPPVLHAYGAPDDHHRLTYLLAEQLQKLLGSKNEDIRTCLDKRSVWSDRVYALQRALDKYIEKHMAGCNANYAFAIADIDALVPSNSDDPDERGLLKERREFFNILRRAIDRRGWVVVRPCPSEEVSRTLNELDCEVRVSSSHGGHDVNGSPELSTEMLETLAPDCRPVAQWLYQTGRLSAETFDEWVDQVDDVAGHILGLAYDALGRRARDTGKLLSAVRQPQPLNNTLGRFDIDGGEPNATSLPRTAVAALSACGFLQPNVDRSTDVVRMPRPIRVLLERHANLSAADEIKKVHARFADDPRAQGSSEIKLEVPFHALRSGNVERAKKEAFYSADLRDYGTRLSREGDYGAAAELFQYLIDTFDPRDAYAHEYLGYNLARYAGMKEKERILRAYVCAHECANERNPLYHGRLLGFRAELGEDVSNEFDRAMHLYTAGKDSKVTYFVKAVFDGLKRGGQDARRNMLATKWQSTLKKHRLVAL